MGPIGPQGRGFRAESALRANADILEETSSILEISEMLRKFLTPPHKDLPGSHEKHKPEAAQEGENTREAIGKINPSRPTGRTNPLMV